MHASEEERVSPCAECGAEVSTTDRVYVFGAGELLCFGCSLKRHGAYDERHDRWRVAPDVADLLERSSLDG